MQSGNNIDFGILQNGLKNQAPPISQVDAETSPENYRANLNASTQLAGVLAQTGVAQQANSIKQQAQNQQFALDSAKFGVDQAKANQQMQFNSENNPNIVASNAAISSKQTTAAAKEAQDWQIHNQGMAAYNKTLQSGSTPQQAFQSLVQVTAANDPEHALNLMKDQTGYNQQLKNNNYQDLSRAGDALYYANIHAQQDGTSLYDLVKSTPSLRKMYPAIPDPTNYANSAQYSNAVAGMYAGSTVAKQALTYSNELNKAAYQSSLDTTRDEDKIKTTAALAPNSPSGMATQINTMSAQLAQLDPNSPQAKTLVQAINDAKTSLANMNNPSIPAAIKSYVGLGNTGNSNFTYSNGTNPVSPQPQQPVQQQVPAQQSQQQNTQSQNIKNIGGVNYQYINGQWMQP